MSFTIQPGVFLFCGVADSMFWHFEDYLKQRQIVYSSPLTMDWAVLKTQQPKQNALPIEVRHHFSFFSRHWLMEWNSENKIMGLPKVDPKNPTLDDSLRLYYSTPERLKKVPDFPLYTSLSLPTALTYINTDQSRPYGGLVVYRVTTPIPLICARHIDVLPLWHREIQMKQSPQNSLKKMAYEEWYAKKGPRNPRSRHFIHQLREELEDPSLETDDPHDSGHLVVSMGRKVCDKNVAGWVWNANQEQVFLCHPSTYLEVYAVYPNQQDLRLQLIHPKRPDKFHPSITEPTQRYYLKPLSASPTQQELFMHQFLSQHHTLNSLRENVAKYMGKVSGHLHFNSIMTFIRFHQVTIRLQRGITLTLQAYREDPQESKWNPLHMIPETHRRMKKLILTAKSGSLSPLVSIICPRYLHQHLTKKVPLDDTYAPTYFAQCPWMMLFLRYHPEYLGVHQFPDWQDTQAYIQLGVNFLNTMSLYFELNTKTKKIVQKVPATPRISHAKTVMSEQLEQFLLLLHRIALSEDVFLYADLDEQIQDLTTTILHQLNTDTTLPQNIRITLQDLFMKRQAITQEQNQLLKHNVTLVKMTQLEQELQELDQTICQKLEHWTQKIQHQNRHHQFSQVLDRITPEDQLYTVMSIATAR